MIKIGIVGYGNLGRACEKSALKTDDMEVTAIFSRRKINSEYGTPVIDIADIKKYIGKIDVMLLCGGSATDIPEQSREIIKYFNTADCFDTHAKMLEYYKDLDKLGREYGHLAVIASGWDPGLFSYMRLLFDTVLPEGDTYTFWGKGVSQGHSEAIRNVDGVKYGIQYTVPREEALNEIRNGKRPVLTVRDKHLRICYVVAEDNFDKSRIEKAIVEMPDYFADYDTTVNFITEQEFLKNHNKMPHGGVVIRAGEVNGTNQNMEFSIKLQSNPDFTASVLVCYARAAAKLASKGVTGAKTVYEIPLIETSAKNIDDVIKNLL